MTNQITATLTRWQKYSARLQAEALMQKAKNQRAVAAGHNLDFDAFGVRQAALQAASDAAVTSGTARYLDLTSAVFAVRRALAHANVKVGVSDLLANREEAKQVEQYYNEMLEEVEGVMSPEEYAALAARKQSGAQSEYRHQVTSASVTFVGAEALAVLQAARDAARKGVTTQDDELADANAEKLTIDLSDEAVAVLRGI